MSYSFNWDCTLPIKNIEDIVSINIVPETNVYDEGDYLSLRGQVCIDGEYVSSTKEQFLFNECIPLDITLPNNDRTTNIKIDVENFDYTIEDGNRLCLNIRLCIAGYNLDSTPTLIEPDEEDEGQEQPPVIFTKEAIFSPKSVASNDDEDLDYLDFDDVAMPSHQEAVELVDEEPVKKDAALPKPFLSEVARKEIAVNQVQNDGEEEGETEIFTESNDEFVPVVGGDVEAVAPIEEVGEEPDLVIEGEVVEELEPVIEAEVVEELEPAIGVEVVEDRDPVIEVEVVEELEPVVEAEVVEELEPVVEAEVVEELEPVIEAEVVEELEPVVEQLSDSGAFVEQASRKETLTDKIKQILNKEPVVVEKKSEPVPTTPATEVVEEVVPVKEEVVKEVEEIQVPVEQKVVEQVATIEQTIQQPISQSTGWEEVISEQTMPTKYHPVMPIPVVQEEVTEPKEMIEEEEILPYPLKQNIKEVTFEEPVVKEKSNLFDMLYGLDQEEEVATVESQETVSETPVSTSIQTVSQPVIQKVQVTQQMTQPVQVTQQITQPVQVEQSLVAVQPVEEEVKESKVAVNMSSSSDDSIASQFSDGESIIKIVFVQEEETTIDDICTKYNVTQDHIYNCANVQSPLCPGDHVMINYGQFRRN
ncbi:hypothetical protein [Turicibacter sanguinis]|uniref:hypothetical protein n=1 Tax=Turicibacter sanguinis TaxID=154288 RepID=UPI00102255B6|nr:hypothetical protein [Turicibacter sanguinis]MTK72214.1 hypothetical protein [Turicibacter sanguinis]MTK80952.1 hypothetical protein [Turicibacter sanguinis]MTL44747.1 hypothetical protein [Turicibacter sanguinis]MTL53768.1 hypothetical protein [Turicibacter sanguinis]MTL80776.1 hypothetical protein [Turicibacter sanguinis]